MSFVFSFRRAFWGIMVCGAFLSLGSAPPRAQDQPKKPDQTLVLTSEMQGFPGKEIKVSHTTYPPGAINPKHYHTGYIIFDVTEGSGMVQEEGKTPVTLKAGDVLLIKPGTIHSHWNPSGTTPWKFTEFVITDQGQLSTVHMP